MINTTYNTTAKYNLDAPIKIERENGNTGAITDLQTATMSFKGKVLQCLSNVPLLKDTSVVTQYIEKTRVNNREMLNHLMSFLAKEGETHNKELQNVVNELRNQTKPLTERDVRTMTDTFLQSQRPVDAQNPVEAQQIEKPRNPTRDEARITLDKQIKLATREMMSLSEKTIFTTLQKSQPEKYFLKSADYGYQYQKTTLHNQLTGMINDTNSGYIANIKEKLGENTVSIMLSKILDEAFCTTGPEENILYFKHLNAFESKVNMRSIDGMEKFSKETVQHIMADTDVKVAIEHAVGPYRVD